MVFRLISRSIQSIFTLFIITVIAFYLIHTMPGTPYALMYASPALQKFLDLQKHIHFLDRPIWEQYLLWLGQLIHRNFGTTMRGNVPISFLISFNLKLTIRLLCVPWVIALLITILWAAYNSTRPYGKSDLASSFISYIGFAFPVFWLGLMLQNYVAMRWLLLPPSALYDYGHVGEFGNLLLHMILPWSVMTFSLLIMYLKYLQSSLLEVLPSAFIRTARAKGASEKRVIFIHAMRNAIIPMIIIFATELPTIIANAGLVGIVFNQGNIGVLFVSSVKSYEYEMLMGITIVMAVIVIGANWLVDVIYTLVDPRIRRSQWQR